MVTQAPEIEHIGELVEEIAASVLLERALRLAPKAREYAQVKRALRRRLDAENLQVDHEYRIGQRRIVPRQISGGGFKVAAWTATRYVVLEDEEDDE